MLTGCPPDRMNPTPRAMPYMPNVPMNGGTRSRAISTPLTSPAGSPASSAAPKPTSTARPSGASGPSRCIASAAPTELRPMTKPVERSMPPEMMTNVCPRAMSIMIATLAVMAWKLNRSRKPLPVAEKNTSRTARNSQAQNRPTMSSSRLPGVTSSADSDTSATGTTTSLATLLALSVTSSPEWLLALVDRRLRVRRIHVGAVDDHVPRRHALLDLAGVATDGLHRIVDAGHAHISRLLSNKQVDGAIAQIGNSLLRRIEVGNSDRP